jgi:hypothetical protein
MLLTGITMVLLPIALVTQTESAQAQSCVKFREVSTGQTSIQKTISINALGRNDWNTDFAVPMGTTFSYFIARVYPQNSANYQVAINLKYNNNASSQVFNQNVPMQRFQLYSKTFRTPTAKQPYQVNMNVGGDVNNVYSVAVLGCR